MAEVLARAPSFEVHFPRLGSVDAVGLEAHAGELAALVVEGVARRRALELAVAALEPPALGRTETPGSVRSLCARAAAASVAAVRVHPRLVAICHDCLRGTGVLVAAPAPATEAARTVELGADGVVLEIDGEAFLCGRYGNVVDEIAWVRTAIGEAELTVTLPTRELGTYDNVRRAALLAMMGGADFVEDAAATLPSALCVLEAICDVHDETGRVVGFEAAGVGSADAAIRHLVLAHETLGAEWLTPSSFRIGGPARLLDELLAELRADS